MNLVIPGYYYDEEKKKYFKIEKSHTAPASAHWSAGNVKRRKIESSAAKAKERRAELTKKHIKRSPVLRDARVGGLLNRELGVVEAGFLGRSLDIDVETSIWARGLTHKGSARLPCGSEQPVGCFWLSSARCDRGSDVPDARMAYLPIRTGSSTMGAWIPIAEDGTISQPLRTWSGSPQRQDGGAHSITYNAKHDKLLMVINDPVSPTIICRPPRVFRNDPPRGSDLRFDGTNDIFATLPGQEARDYFQITAAPCNSELSGVVGARAGMALLHGDYRLSFRKLACTKRKTDVLTQAFHTTNPNILYAGTRSSDFCRLDLRTGPAQDRIMGTHKSSIAHMATFAGNEHRILAAGPRSSMAMYDTRYMRAGRTSPVFRFDAFANEARTDFGFAVSEHAGAVAVIDDQGVRLFSTATGRLMDSPALRSGKDMQGASALQFDTAPDETVSLWVAKGTRLSKYSVT